MFDRLMKFAAASVLATGTAGGAAAQSLDLGDYSGPYAGLLIGYGAVDIENEVGGTKRSATGFDFAGFVGYELRDNRIYYSAEFELYTTTKQDDVTGLEAEKDLGYAINGRVGYFLSDGTLVYGLVGVELADFSVGTGGEEVLGGRIGAGAEFRVTENVSVRSEAIYTIYQDANLGTAQTEDISDLTVRVGGVYRFQF